MNDHADVITRARALLQPGQTLKDLFLKPSEDAREFVSKLTNRERLALEEEARKP